MIRIRIKMDLTKTKACQELIGYRFYDPLLLWEALQTKGSYTCAVLDEQATDSRYKSDNRRLAIVGDEVMNILLSEKWYPSSGSRHEYTKLKSQLTSNAHFRAVANKVRLQRFMTKPKDSDHCPPSTVSDTVEAIVGAAYIDGGLSPAKTVERNLGILNFQQSASRSHGFEKSGLALGYVKPRYFYLFNTLLADY
ncbi:MAG: hypothetical protein Q9171_005813 [Xanthocarpia ochracea]